MNDIISFLKSMKADHITLLSIFVTFIIYSLGKRNELRMKKHEVKKEHYLKFLELQQGLLQKLSVNKNISSKSVEGLLGTVYEPYHSLINYFR